MIPTVVGDCGSAALTGASRGEGGGGCSFAFPSELGRTPEGGSREIEDGDGILRIRPSSGLTEYYRGAVAVARW